MTDNVDSVALLETDERSCQNLFSVVHDIGDRSQHPVHAGTHEVEAGLIIQLLELLLLPALSGLHRVLVEVAPSGFNRLRGNVVNLSSREQLQRPRHKSLATSRCLLLDKKGI